MPKRGKAKANEQPSQRTYYVGAEYIDSGDRLLVEEGDDVSLYSMNLELAQHWYAAAWRGKRVDLEPFKAQRLDWGMEAEQADQIKNSGLVLAQCVRHGIGMPVAYEHNSHPVYGSGAEILIGEVFEAALGHLIEAVTGIAGLTISPMHSGYALHQGKRLGTASPVEEIAQSVGEEAPDLGAVAAPDGTVTVLFSDIKDSTALNEAMGDEQWMAVLRQHNDIIRREVGLHSGFEVKTIGDAFMVAFKSAKDGLRCAMAIQRALRKRNEKAEQPILVRIGLHVGELVREGKDFFGSHVNFAARVQSAAEPDTVVVSQLFRDVVAPHKEFTFAPLPKKPFKGFPGEQQLYVANIAGEQAPGVVRDAPLPVSVSAPLHGAMTLIRALEPYEMAALVAVADTVDPKEGTPAHSVSASLVAHDFARPLVHVALVQLSEQGLIERANWRDNFGAFQEGYRLTPSGAAWLHANPEAIARFTPPPPL
jgi:class 3 adenylate cyclase